MAAKTWARIYAIILASLSAIFNLTVIAANPMWSIIVIAVDVLVIYAMAVHGDEVETARAALGRLTESAGTQPPGRRTAMSTLIAIGYPDEKTATVAGEEVQRLARDLIIEPDAVAVIRRDRGGKFHVTTNHHAVGDGATWGMFWGLLFGVLFFIPVFGMAIGAGLGALMGKVEKAGIDRTFQDQVRDMMQPGTSALFMVVEKVDPGQGGGRREEVRRNRADVIAVGEGGERATGSAARPAGGIAIVTDRSGRSAGS